MARRAFAALALLALLVGLAAPVEARPTEASDPDVIQGSWIVTLVDGSDPAREGPALARQYGGAAGHIYDAVLGGFQFLGSDRAAANMSRNPRVQRVEVDRVLRLFSETIPTGVSRIRAAHATEPTSLSLDPPATGAGVSIAILDTGIETTHEDLSANIVRDLTDNVVGVSCIDGEGFEDDGHGHGTHVAGTAAAAAGNDKGVIGVASEAGLIPVKVLSKSGSGSWSSVACGVNWVTNNVSTYDIAVANMSLGGSGSAGDGCSSSALRQAICDSVAAGVTYSVAAGNSSDDAAKFVPAAYPEVITVSAFADYDGEPGPNGTCYRFVGPGGGIECDDGLATFTNDGEIVDVTAPGRWIYSSDKGNGYSEKSGTSMAAPHVAGVAALVKARYPGATPDDVRAHLQATGECPGVTANDGPGNCDPAGDAWYNDSDGFTEPLVNALWAATATALVTAPSTSEAGPEPDTGTLTGTVTDTDSTGAPIVGATVAIGGTSLSTTTG
ncbi:MAG TPA: S8 family serine peptidase, partial [Acidimicrobiales bacterium]|nr:S8 family serine peptidase [Acidimicrobiales bacterium]